MTEQASRDSSSFNFAEQWLWLLPPFCIGPGWCRKGAAGSEPRRRPGEPPLWPPHNSAKLQLSNNGTPAPGGPKRDRAGLKVRTLRRKIMAEDKGHLTLCKLFFFLTRSHFTFSLIFGWAVEINQDVSDFPGLQGRGFLVVVTARKCFFFLFDGSFHAGRATV